MYFLYGWVAPSRTDGVSGLVQALFVCWTPNAFLQLTVFINTWQSCMFYLFLKTQNLRGRQFNMEKWSNFARNSHLDPFGDRNDVQELLLLLRMLGHCLLLFLFFLLIYIPTLSILPLPPYLLYIYIYMCIDMNCLHIYIYINIYIYKYICTHIHMWYTYVFIYIWIYIYIYICVHILEYVSNLHV